MRPRRTLPKKKRQPEDLRKRLDRAEAVETADWAADLKRRAWKQSDDYHKRQELDERYKERAKPNG